MEPKENWNSIQRILDYDDGEKREGDLYGKDAIRVRIGLQCAVGVEMRIGWILGKGEEVRYDAAWNNQPTQALIYLLTGPHLDTINK